MALINETMARKYWPDEDPIGKGFALNFSSWFPKAEIIGVVSDIKTNGLNSRSVVMLANKQLQG